MTDVAILIAGVVALVAALATVVVARRRRPTVVSSAGLIAPDNPLRPPAGLTPALALALREGEIGVPQIKLTLVDLAARGYLRISEISPKGSHSPDWMLTRLPVPERDLLDYERALLKQLETPTLMKAWMASAKRFEVARTGLAAELRARDWFSAPDRSRASRWGLAGAALLVLGLLAVATMLISWLATQDFRGVIGGFALVMAGVILTSQGQKRSLTTQAGMEMKHRCKHLAVALAAFEPQQVDLDRASAQLRAMLPWAICFGSEKQVAESFALTSRNASAWGRHVDCVIDWFEVPAAEGDLAAQARRIAFFCADSRRRLALPKPKELFKK